MRKVIVNEFVALDGTAQAPGGPDEDTSGGFVHGVRDERVDEHRAADHDEVAAVLEVTPDDRSGPRRPREANLPGRRRAAALAARLARGTETGTIIATYAPAVAAAD